MTLLTALVAPRPIGTNLGLLHLLCLLISGRPLTTRGRSNRTISAELALSVRTVERHITNLCGKIDANNRADATAYAYRHALI
jgi:ATP/maltotriose-dependent transcriptional regulator MalT